MDNQFDTLLKKKLGKALDQMFWTGFFCGISVGVGLFGLWISIIK